MGSWSPINQWQGKTEMGVMQCELQNFIFSQENLAVAFGWVKISKLDLHACLNEWKSKELPTTVRAKTLKWSSSSNYHIIIEHEGSNQHSLDEKMMIASGFPIPINERDLTSISVCLNGKKDLWVLTKNDNHSGSFIIKAFFASI